MNMKAVVIDDSPDCQEIVRGGLELHNFQVETAPSARAGLEAVRQLLPDLILLDINLPDQDGWEVLRRLKQDRSTSAIPVIMVSAVGSLESQRQAFSLGASDYMVKPMDLSLLTARSQIHARDYQKLHNVALDLKNAQFLQNRFASGSKQAVQQFLKHHQLDVEVFSHAADDLSGDFFCSKPTRHPSGAGLMLGDACGHGITAGLLTMRILSLLEKIGSPSWHPSEFLDQLNGELVNALPGGSFVAATYTIFTPDRAIFSGAGLPRPLLLRQGEVWELPFSGFPLGLEQHEERQEISVPFEADDLLFFATDGLVETRNANNEEFGIERIKELCLQHAAAPPFGLVRRIFEALVVFRGDEHFDDDLTMIAVKRSPP